MAETYPATLPCFLREAPWQMKNNIINSDMANGESIGRRRFAERPPSLHQVKLSLTAAQLKTWDDFVTITLGFTKSFDAPITTTETQGNYGSDGKAIPLTTVRLQKTDYTITEKAKGKFEISGIVLEGAL